MRRRLAPFVVAPALVLTALAGPGVAAAATSSSSGAVPATSAPAGIRVVPSGTQGLTAGAALLATSPGATAAALARLERDGFNTVAIFVWWLTAGPSSDTLAPYQGTQSDASLSAEIHQARADGLSVSLTPVFYCSACQGGWRGTMAPSDIGLFFRAYADFVDHYAALSAADGVGTFFVGSEMSSLENQTTRWRRVIDGVRHRFHGTLAYEENWDVLGQAQFLSSLDEIGVSAYFPLDDQAAPNLTRLLSDWTSSQSSAAPGRDWVAALSSLAARTGKPIVFGEAGYMSGDYAARQPFLDFRGQPDWQLQSDLYQALLTTFSGRSWWRGVDWWQWFPPGRGATDDTRTPEAKTAESLLGDWYAKGWRPVSSGDALPLLASGQGTSSAAGADAARIESAASPATVTVPGVMAPDRPMVLTGAAGVVAGPALPGLAPAGAAYRGGPDRSTDVGLAGLVALLMLLSAVVWLTLGRRPPGASATASAGSAPVGSGSKGVVPASPNSATRAATRRAGRSR